MDAAIDAIDVHEKIKSLEELKEVLVANLRDFKHRFIVVIDDTDRLEPAEAAEIARLVRAVGDFPNIVYLMCYDRDVLANSLQNAIQVNDGKAFLEKIIQISFPVPRPEEFDLRRWLLEECGNLHAAVSEKAQSQDVSERRLAAVCDAQGQQLQTPRDVVHVINALRLIYPSIANEVDFADLCWLQIIRLKNNDLYKWIEEYLTVLAAVTIDGAAINEVDKTDFAKRLNTLMPDSDISLSPRSIWYLGRHIPSVTQNTKGTCNVFENVSPETFAELEQNVRLGSPHHYRLYFAFAQPAGALNDSVIKAIIEKAGEGKSVVTDFEELIDKKRPQGGSMYEVLLDRIKRWPVERLSLQGIKTIVAAIGDTVDRAHQQEREPGFYQTKWVWKNARSFFARALERIAQDERSAFLSDTFSDRKSIGWLVSEIIGTDCFAHGRAGSKPENYGKCLLKNEELDEAIKIMFSRLAGPDRDRVIDVPDSLAFFYRWKQAGGEEDLKKWMGEQSSTDSGFLKLLHKCRSWVASSSEGVSYPLNKRDVEAFMDFDAVIERLANISQDINAPEKDRELAIVLRAAVKTDD